ncbi:DUF2812 domain-containing protein [Haloimpatiens massiliensis]|uniref:DUF2812 domain-containing protein n=1 Tax=Haloimpatiens massiliensis TaxID=1658110 RepID=UPI000C836D49|nr:DUF2812 domain-containing protein [Haloimpatiens massiliensis]
MNKNIRKMSNNGWDISKNTMLDKMSQWAKEGWLLHSSSIFSFEFIKGEPQDLIYTMDFQEHIDDLDEYLMIFKHAGWEFVCESYGYRIFKASPGTLPIYTDPTPLEEARKKRVNINIFLLVFSIALMAVFSFIGHRIEGGAGEIFFIILVGIAAASFGWNITWFYGLHFRKNK